MQGTKDARAITPGLIYDEAKAANGNTREILEKLSAPAEGEDDPLADLTAAIAEMIRTQGLILRRLDAIERKLDSPQRS